MNETAGLDGTIATTIRTLRAMREAQSFEACMADHEYRHLLGGLTGALIDRHQREGGLPPEWMVEMLSYAMGWPSAMTVLTLELQLLSPEGRRAFGRAAPTFRALRARVRQTWARNEGTPKRGDVDRACLVISVLAHAEVTQFLDGQLKEQREEWRDLLRDAEEIFHDEVILLRCIEGWQANQAYQHGIDETMLVEELRRRWKREFLQIREASPRGTAEFARMRTDLKGGVIRLRPEDTKTQEGRIIPLTKELSETLKNATIYLDEAGHRVPYVFTYAGRRIGAVRRAFETACRQAGISGVVFHDLRHTFVTNLRRAGVDALTAMKISGHKTMAVFKRYNTIDAADLHQAIGQMDTSMDTSAAAAEPLSPNSLKTKRAPVAQADRARDS